MRNMDPVFPHYQFGKHKGYSTRLHQDAVRQHGRSIVHRMRFLENQEFEMQMQEQQQSFLEIPAQAFISDNPEI